MTCHIFNNIYKINETESINARADIYAIGQEPACVVCRSPNGTCGSRFGVGKYNSVCRDTGVRGDSVGADEAGG